MPSPGLVIFDMDGTLTRPYLDFDRIRAEIGLPPRGEPILEAIARFSPEDRARAEAILRRHEVEAAEASELQPGAAEVVAAIRAAGVPTALMTRNSRWSVEHFLRRHGLAFDHVRTREDGVMKPAPEPIYEICKRFGVSPGDAWHIGDFHFDILCGAAAGSRTVLLWDPEQPLPEWAQEADHVIRQLSGLLTCLGLDGCSRVAASTQPI